MTASLLAVLLTVVGCSAQITAFSFNANGKSVILRTARLYAKEKQGELVPVNGKAKTGDGIVRRTLRYSLIPAQTVTTDASDFYLTYVPGNGPLKLHLFERTPGAKTLVQTTAILPLSSNNTHVETGSTSKGTPSEQHFEYLVPVRVGTQIEAFQVTSSSRKANVRIDGAGLTRGFAGVRFGKKTLSIRDGMTVAESSPTGTENVTTVRFPGLVDNLGATQTQIVVTYTYRAENGSVRLRVESSSGKHRDYKLLARRGTHALYLYTASCGFPPEAVSVTSADPGFSLESVAVHRFPTPHRPQTSRGTTSPIPAGFGVMIDYRQEFWRQKDYELFSWSLVPSVIVMQFRSYAVQARFMKRFAFFIEKDGFTGKLRTNAQLAGLHGWNAHDYRPEDLARFYTTAARENFKLNPEEEQLKRILLTNGLIEHNGTTYSPGKGAILTFAHVGSYRLRRLLLTHEGFHGVYFTHPAYRKAVLSIWNHTAAAEQELFRNVFLDYKRYNVDDPYLVRNEFQAYLMQQPLSSVQAYFDYELPREMKKMKIPGTAPPARYLSEHPAVFRRSAEQVQEALEQAVGVTAGELVDLEPYRLPDSARGPRMSHVVLPDLGSRARSDKCRPLPYGR